MAMKRVDAALVGGVAGSFAMDVAQNLFTGIFERNRPPEVQDEEVEAIVGVVRVIAKYAPIVGTERVAGPVGHALHYAFGCGFALAYVAVRERVPAIGIAGGAVFGTALWIVSDRVLIPAFKLGRPWARYSPSERTNALVSHLAYAMTVEAIAARR
jgi:uncharacterized membrane protein YagU involved in acid resistance